MGDHGVTGSSVAINMPGGIDSAQFRGHAVLIGAAEEQVLQRPPPPVIFLQGDFLAIGSAEADALVRMDAAFDRGGLVAVQPDCRERYAKALHELLVLGGRVLLIVV